VSRKSSSDTKPAFKPGGGHLARSQVEYMSPAAREDGKAPQLHSSSEKAWKSGSPALVTSPHPSIVFMNLRV
jgi:hypothetical protein